MARNLRKFDTLNDYQTAELVKPAVSLIAADNSVHFDNIVPEIPAVLGDVLMYDNVNGKLVKTDNAQWDSTTYPIEQYEPIAVNIYPASQTSDGKSIYMALKWASNVSATGSASAVSLMWGQNSTDPGDITSNDQNAMNGRENTDKVVAVMPGTSGNTQAEYPIFYAVNQFHTNGTSAGDWYVPSKGELALFQSHFSTIRQKIRDIRSASTSIVNTVVGYQWTSTEALYGGTTARGINNEGDFNSGMRNGGDFAVRGVIKI